ncbi:MAG: MarC family protein [Planctomycetota bacterium]
MTVAERAGTLRGMTLLSAAALLFLVMDPPGNAIVFPAITGHLEASRRRRVLVRELLFALGVMVAFLFGGGPVLTALQIGEPALAIAGGVVLFLIALQMTFEKPDASAPGPGPGVEQRKSDPSQEPFFVPMAVPFIAGPSVLATLLLVNAKDPERWPIWLLALLLAWAANAAVLLFADLFTSRIGPRATLALQKLMGLLLTAVAVEQFLSGVSAFLDARGL